MPAAFNCYGSCHSQTMSKNISISHTQANNTVLQLRCEASEDVYVKLTIKQHRNVIVCYVCFIPITEY